MAVSFFNAVSPRPTAAHGRLTRAADDHQLQSRGTVVGSTRDAGHRSARSATVVTLVGLSTGLLASARRHSHGSLRRRGIHAAQRSVAPSADAAEGDDPLRADLEVFLRNQRAAPPVVVDPLGGPLTSYSDNPFDFFMISVFRLVMTAQASWRSALPFWGPQAYDGMLEVAHALQWKKSLQETEDSSIGVIDELIPAAGKERFRELLKTDKFGTEINAWITAVFFPFMVGKCEVEARTSEEVPRIPAGESWNCAVKIEKCRWLEKSGCVGMCVGLCKRPMQRMFGGILGMPLSMEPNMEDLSCTMVFGKEPVPWDIDKLQEQPCFSTCATARKGPGVCTKLR